MMLNPVPPSPSPRVGGGARPDSGAAIYRRAPSATTLASPRPRAARTSREACDEAQLATPFHHRRNEFHTSQQNALNAELRATAESCANQIPSVLASVRAQLEQLPAHCDAVNHQTLNALTAYDEGYGCTEHVALSAERLIAEFRRRVTVQVLDDVLVQLQHEGADMQPATDDAAAAPPPRLNVAGIAATLDRLLVAERPLPQQPVLERCAAELRACDRASAPLPRQQAPLDVAAAVVALHERCFVAPAASSLSAAAASDDELETLLREIAAARTAKEAAVAVRDTAAARTHLATQVALSNDLCRRHLARTALLGHGAEDAAEDQREADALLKTASEIAERFAARIAEVRPPVADDLADLARDIESARKQHVETAAAIAADERDARRQFRDLETAETAAWRHALEAVAVVGDCAEAKRQFAGRRLVAKERAARQLAVQAELIRGQEAHAARLRLGDEALARGAAAAAHVAAYVAAMGARLRAGAARAGAEVADARLREGRAFVRHYELFVFGAEEARAKAQARVEGLEFAQRSRRLDIDAAAQALDPHAETYRLDVAAATAEAATLRAYMALVDDWQQQRRAEVEPTIRHVAALDLLRAASAPPPGDAASASPQRRPPPPPLRSPSPAPLAALAARASDSARATPPPQAASASALVFTPEAAAAAAAADAAEDSARRSPELKASSPSPPLALAPHPHVAARVLGLRHDEIQSERAREYIRAEQDATEGRLSDIRRAKNEQLQQQRQRSATAAAAAAAAAQSGGGVDPAAKAPPAASSSLPPLDRSRPPQPPRGAARQQRPPDEL